jgi:hypothetical protein
MGYRPEDVAAMRESLGTNQAADPAPYQPQPQPYRPVQPATHNAGTARPRTSLMPNVEAPARWSGETFTQEWSSALENAASDHARFLQECAGYERDLMPEAYSDLRHAFKDTEAGKLVATAPDAYKGRADLADARVAAILDGLASQADIPGSGSRPIRVRDRLQRAVDKAAPGAVASIVAKAIADAADSDLPTIVQEAPSMLQAADVEPEFLNAVLAQRVPQLADAMAEQKKAEMSRHCVSLNAARLQKAIRNAEPLRVPLVNPVALGLDPDANHVA